jgi:calmodulin
VIHYRTIPCSCVSGKLDNPRRFSQTVATVRSTVQLPAARHSGQLNDFREIFRLVDLDGGGSISPEELSELMAMLGISVTKEELDDMINEIDEDGDGDISFEEFVAVMTKQNRLTKTPAEVTAAFQNFAAISNPPGTIRYKELERALSSYGSVQVRV